MNHIYHLDECVVPLPQGFRDATVQAFEWTVDGGETLSLLLQREPSDGRKLGDVMRAHTHSYPSRLLAYREESPMALDTDRVTVGKRFRWRHDSGVLYHHQVFVALGSVVLIITASCKASHRESVDALVELVIGGLQAREPS